MFELIVGEVYDLMVLCDIYLFGVMFFEGLIGVLFLEIEFCLDEWMIFLCGCNCEVFKFLDWLCCCCLDFDFG